MKNFEIMARSSGAGWRSLFRPARFSRPARRHQPGNDDAVIGVHALFDDAQIADLLAKLDFALLDHVVLVDDEHVASALVAADDAIRHEQRVGLGSPRHAHAHEISRQQRAVGVRQHAAHQQRAGRRGDARRGVVERSLVRIARLALQADLDRDFLQIFAGEAPLP